MINETIKEENIKVVPTRYRMSKLLMVNSLYTRLLRYTLHNNEKSSKKQIKELSGG